MRSDFTDLAAANCPESPLVEEPVVVAAVLPPLHATTRKAVTVANVAMALLEAHSLRGKKGRTRIRIFRILGSEMFWPITLLIGCLDKRLRFIASDGACESLRLTDATQLGGAG